MVDPSTFEPNASALCSKLTPERRPPVLCHEDGEWALVSEDQGVSPDHPSVPHQRVR